MLKHTQTSALAGACKAQSLPYSRRLSHQAAARRNGTCWGCWAGAALGDLADTFAAIRRALEPGAVDDGRDLAAELDRVVADLRWGP